MKFGSTHMAIVQLYCAHMYTVMRAGAADVSRTAAIVFMCSCSLGRGKILMKRWWLAPMTMPLPSLPSAAAGCGLHLWHCLVGVCRSSVATLLFLSYALAAVHSNGNGDHLPWHKHMWTRACGAVVTGDN